MLKDAEAGEFDSGGLSEIGDTLRSSVEDKSTPIAWRRRQRHRRNGYIEAQSLVWWSSPSRLPALLQSDQPGTSIFDVGAASTTRTVVGDQDVGEFAHAGLGLRLGRFVPRSRISRIELAGFWLFENSDDLSSRDLDAGLILSRPFENAATGQSDAQIVRMDGLVDGSFDAEYSRTLAGLDPSISFCLVSNDCRWLEFQTGYRLFWLQDELELREDVVLAAGGLVAPDTRFQVNDEFQADNVFHLWRFGLTHTENHGKWMLRAQAGLGLGFVHQRVRINGQTTSSVGDTVTAVDRGGFLALDSNMGDHDRHRFAWVPDLNIRLRRQLTDRWSVSAGYSLIWLPNAVGAVDHVPTTIDPGQLPPVQPGGTGDPAFAFVEDTVFVHGLQFGLQADW